MSSTLGRALIEFWGGGRLRSYTAKGWHAQISKLTEHSQGAAAADAAGLDVTHRTLVDWLAERREPSAENQRKIRAAYERLAGGWDPAHERHQYEITGLVKTGDDERYRGVATGRERSAPFRIDGREGRWGRIADAYQSGSLDEDQAEEYFIEDVIDEDIGSGSDEWEFPGASYTIR